MDKYRIQVKDLPSRLITEMFSDLTITPLENGEAQLTATLADQAALRGLLNHLWDLNTTVITVEKDQTFSIEMK